MQAVTIERCTRTDFLDIREDQIAFWGSDRVLPIHHAMLIEEFGDTAFVVRDGPTICAYLFGFFAQTGRYFYVHLVAVRDTHRGRGFGRALYAHVDQLARDAGLTAIKAITQPSNTDSIAFHRALGFELTGDGEEDGLPCMSDYAGRGRHRAVMIKTL